MTQTTTTFACGVTGTYADNMGDPVETDHTVTLSVDADRTLTITVDGETVREYPWPTASIIMGHLATALGRTQRPTVGTIGLTAEVTWDLGDGIETIDVGPHAHRIVSLLQRAGIQPL